MEHPTQPSRELRDSSDPGRAAEAGDVVIVEDDRTGMHPVTLERAVLDHLRFTRMKDLTSATRLDVYHAVAHAVRDRLVERWIQTQRAYTESNVKRVYYLSAEFLIGRLLASNLISLGLYEQAATSLREYGIELSDLLEEEADPGLGNGGLGRLAACFLDSMATLQLPGYGYGIRYEFGIFEQRIEDGWQVERARQLAALRQPVGGAAPRVHRAGPVRRSRRGSPGHQQPLRGQLDRGRDRAGRAVRHADRRLRQRHGQHPAPVVGARDPRVRLQRLQRRRLPARGRGQGDQREHLQGALPQRRVGGGQGAATAAAVLLRLPAPSTTSSGATRSRTPPSTRSPTRSPSSSTTPTRPSRWPS